MFFFYRILTNFIFLISPIIIIYRIINKKEDPKRFVEKIGSFKKINKNDDLLWFHGSSVGEVLSIIPLIEKNFSSIFSIGYRIPCRKVFKSLET